MKKGIYILFFVIYYNSVFSQSYEIVYKITKDTIPFKGNTVEQTQILNNKGNIVYAIVRDYNFILKFNSTESIYQIEDHLDNESYNELDITMAKLLGGGVSLYYQNKPKQTMIVSFEENGKRINEIFTLKKNWTITNKSGKIGNFNVYKAVYGSNIEAWFTTDIPVPFGPMGYGGLPGLILKIKLGKRIIYADIIKKMNKKIKIKKPKGIEIQHEELKKKRMQEFLKLTQGER